MIEYIVILMNKPSIFKDFPLFPMFQDAFEKLELADIATILDQVNPEFEGTQFDPVETTILSLNLSFYPGFQLLDIADYTLMPLVQRFVVYAHEKAVILDFTNEPIYALNKDIPISLNEENVADYVRFFFSFVRGRHGRFIITENVDDIAWKEDPPPAARKAVGKMIKALEIKEIKKDGTFLLEARMMFKDSLFKTNVEVKADGLVTLQNEELLIEDMPVLDDVFGQ